ncbi:MAG: DUF4145 domain-containing protein [Ignavibacteriaceae bacterium]|nr:DUF4145 domain-containing protein [Ignavibacteriaceae bacterium]
MTKIYKIPAHATSGTPQIILRCPGCKTVGYFVPFGNINDIESGQFSFGQRRCPDPQCATHVFVVYEMPYRKLLNSYPVELIDFDQEGLPESIVHFFNEALTCFSESCYYASALMIRRTLEEICDLNGATGKTLNDRIDQLKTKATLSPEIFESLHVLRMLGNDAAHVKSKDFENIGKEELEAAIELVKVILKAVYQNVSLLKRLKALQKK